MPDSDHELRPDAETFDHAGSTVTVIDAPGILASAAERRVELFHDALFPPPIRRVRASITRTFHDGEPVALMTAVIHAGAVRGGLTIGVLGNDPISVLISRRVAAGDAWATRVVDGATTAVAKVTRRLRLDRVPVDADDVGAVLGTSTRSDDATGLVATLTIRSVPDEGSARIAGLSATLPWADVTTEHIAAMARLTLDVIAEAVRQVDTHSVKGSELANYPVTVAATTRRATGVSLDQIGGLDHTVEQLRQLALSFRHPQAMARWGARRPQGLLLYGPPGTGKTLLTKALAEEISASFIEIRTPDILDKWLGGSERNIKRIFRDARAYREPTVMLFDEFDSIISYVGDGQDSGSQAINAVAGIFKQEMNNLIEANPNVIVVATTNFPERVDASLLRSGRFDIKLMIPRPDEAGRAQILTKMIRHRIAQHEVAGFHMFADDLDIARLAALSNGMTGADLNEVLRRSQLAKAMHEARTGSTAEPITTEDLRREVETLRTELAANMK